MTLQFRFITYLELFTMVEVEVTDSHSCSFMFLISPSKYIFYLWHVDFKDMIQWMVTFNSKAYVYKEEI